MALVPLDVLRMMIDDGHVNIRVEGECLDGMMWVELEAEPLDEQLWTVSINTGDDSEFETAWEREVPTAEVEKHILEVVLTLQNVFASQTENGLS
jgi:hypothetical protein